MKIGLVGYQGSGKSTVFEWMTGQKPDPALGHTAQSAMAVIPELRIEGLCRIYKPKKVTMASLELVDTPGLSRSHEGSAARLALIREAGCLVLVIDAYGRSDPKADLETFDADLMLADMEIVTNRITRVEEALRKPLPRVEHESFRHEQATLKTVLEALERGKPLRESDMTDDQLRVTRSFRLFGEKPRVVIFNTADDEARPERFTSLNTPQTPMLALPAGLELELARMDPADRAEFQAELGVGGTDRDAVIRTLLKTSRQRLFLTAGEKEVRSWLLPQGGTALDAAAAIHTDLAKGFIRAEIFDYRDLVRLGSEREVKAAHLVRQEPKGYVIQDDDILFIHFSK
jgi:ribosome-binding ATPase YchF (GTP1/OBG family)